jgi:catechol 2,3-dioxygenase-like lactoylglutathione lyase family enzyme
MASPIRGVYEVVVRVRNLERAERFYRDVLGFELGLRIERGPMSFFRVGTQQEGGMCVLQEDAGDWPPQHFAFRVAEADFERATVLLAAHGVETRGPVQHDWMPARSLYFSDPDGHELEFCAPLSQVV